MADYKVLGPHGWYDVGSPKGVIRIAGEKLVRGEGAFQLFKNHEALGKPRTRRRAMLSVGWLARTIEVGDVIGVRRGDGEEVLRFRRSQPAFAVIDTSGNDKCDLCWSAVKTKFPHVSFLGAYVCKLVAGTTVHSQHSYGNALDIGASTMAQLQAIAAWLIRDYKKFSLHQVIVGDRVWAPGEGWRAYTGEYHYHVHVDFEPNFDPSLPCGVRG